MWHMLWPVLMVVMSNVFYNISQKSTPSDLNPYASLMVTYLIGSLVTAVLFICTSEISSLSVELKKINWTAFLLGASIVGLEIGYLYLFRNGWKISEGSVVCNIVLAVVLLIVGALFYNETITLKQTAGIAVCALGLYLLTV